MYTDSRRKIFEVYISLLKEFSILTFTSKEILKNSRAIYRKPKDGFGLLDFGRLL